MMFWRFGLGDYIILVMVFWFALFPLIFLGWQSDKIDISFSTDYLDEYNRCQEDLERTQPICPACKCGGGAGWFFWLFIGLVWGVLGSYWYQRDIAKSFKTKRRKK